MLALPLCTYEGRLTHKSGQEKDAYKEVASNQYVTSRRGDTSLFCSSKQVPRLCLGTLKGFFDIQNFPLRTLHSLVTS